MMLNLAVALSRSGQAECLIAVSGEGPMLSAPLPAACQFLRLAVPLPWYLRLASDEGAPARFFREQGPALEQLVRAFRDWGAEVVVVNTLTMLAGLLTAARLNLPTVAWVHGIIDQHLLPHHAERFKLACDEAILRSATRIV